MTLSAFLLGFLISSLFGAVFHLIFGGRAWRLLLFLVLGWIGFWAGHFTAQLLGWTFGSLGPIRLAMATLGSLIFLGLGYWLSLVQQVEE